MDHEPQTGRAIVYEGEAESFIGLAAINLLLTIVTIGIYRFWAKSNVRKHLWERTRVFGDTLEWQGTGLQLLIGALIAAVLVLLPFGLLSVVFQGLVARREIALAFVLELALVLGLLYILNVGAYRSWRYLLARTAWRGIRGGMRTGGWAYGWLGLRMTLLQAVTLGLTVPYTGVRMWNALWSDASFGSTPMVAAANWRPLQKRYWLVWAASFALFIGFEVVIFGQLMAMKGMVAHPDPRTLVRLLLTIYGLGFVIGILLTFIWVGYHAAFQREVMRGLSLGTLGFGFDASTGTWLRYYLTNIAIVVGTLGFGFFVMPYRHFTFFVKHITTVGAVDTAAMGQTALRAPGQGDGIADAFDLAAI